MTKDEWKHHRDHLTLILGDYVRVTYHWNFGRTVCQRSRTLEGILWVVEDSGTEIHTSAGTKRLSYKVIECIDDPSDDYGDGFVWLRDGDGTMYSTIM